MVLVKVIYFIIICKIECSKQVTIRGGDNYYHYCLLVVALGKALVVLTHTAGGPEASREVYIHV